MEAPADSLQRMMSDARKRRRDEMEEEEEESEPELELADLPAEMQVKLIEGLERVHAGARPSPGSKLAEADKMWRWLYAVWIEGRNVQLERPTDAFTIARARLFVSPRWKLITHMNWSASSAILRAFEREHAELLVFFRTESAGWFASVLKEASGKSAASVVRETITTSYEGDHLAFDESRTIASALDGPATRIETRIETLDPASDFGPVDAALTYGFVINLVASPRTVYPRDEMNQIFLALRLAFAGPAWGRFRPEMLAWQDKVAVMRVVAEDPPPPSVLTAYDVAGEEVLIETALKPEDVLGSIGDAIDAARRAEGPREPEGGTYAHTVLEWHNGAITAVHSAGRGWVDDPTTDLRIFREAIESEPRLKVFLPKAGHGWGYDGSMYIPERRGPGLLIMPLPWLFYLAEQRISLAKVAFAWSINKTLIFNLAGGTPLTYATHDLVWLPDDLPDAELASLAMLQRRDIPERATARLEPDVEPL